MPLPTSGVLTLAILTLSATASAQSVDFTRTLDVGSPAVVDIETDSGAIEVIAGEPGRVVIDGTVTVRLTWNVPADAERIARSVAAAPPVSQDGSTIRLRTPTDGQARRAVALSYRVHVPRGTRVQAVTQSGTTTIREVGGVADVRTGSSAIEIEGASHVSAVTGSGSLTVRGVSGSTRAESGSSAIRLSGIAGPLDVTTRSGRVELAGTPGPWTISTGSSAVLLTTAHRDLSLDLTSRSGNISVEGARASGDVGKHRVAGRIGSGDAIVKVTTGSGAIRLEVR
jgi:hypothetical protein